MHVARKKCAHKFASVGFSYLLKALLYIIQLKAQVNINNYKNEILRP